jgi:hypothetical protein
MGNGVGANVAGMAIPRSWKAAFAILIARNVLQPKCSSHEAKWRFWIFDAFDCSNVISLVETGIDAFRCDIACW